jgi:DNA-binding response OmpR family regulator
MRNDRIYDDQPSTPLIFVVEDDKDIASLIAHTVKGAGFAPRVFPDGQLVVEAAQEQLPALNLLDLMLPGLISHTYQQYRYKERVDGCPTPIRQAPNTGCHGLADTVLALP